MEYQEACFTSNRNPSPSLTTPTWHISPHPSLHTFHLVLTARRSVNLGSNPLYGTVPGAMAAIAPFGLGSIAWKDTCITGATSTVVGCSTADRPALVDLFTATSTSMTTWVNGASTCLNPAITPCSWFGVVCSSGVVVSISLRQSGLTGVLPVSVGTMTGLTSLDLSANSLSGTIPTSLANCTGIVYVPRLCVSVLTSLLCLICVCVCL